MLRATTEAERGACETKTTQFAWKDTHATWRTEARKATLNIATVQLFQATEQKMEWAQEA